MSSLEDTRDPDQGLLGRSTIVSTTCDSKETVTYSCWTLGLFRKVFMSVFDTPVSYNECLTAPKESYLGHTKRFSESLFWIENTVLDRPPRSLFGDDSALNLQSHLDDDRFFWQKLLVGPCAYGFVVEAPIYGKTGCRDCEN